MTGEFVCICIFPAQKVFVYQNLNARFRRWSEVSWYGGRLLFTRFEVAGGAGRSQRPFVCVRGQSELEFFNCAREWEEEEEIHPSEKIVAWEMDMVPGLWKSERFLPFSVGSPKLVMCFGFFHKDRLLRNFIANIRSSYRPGDFIDSWILGLMSFVRN